jgi:seryl-tRNA synthetase
MSTNPYTVATHAASEDKMTDIVGRLRAQSWTMASKAADEIERLEAEAERRLDINGRMRVELANAQAEIERLRAERDQFAEQAAMRDNRDADMQELMRINNKLKAEIERLRAVIKEIHEISTKWGNSIPWQEGERIAQICTSLGSLG